MKIASNHPNVLSLIARAEPFTTYGSLRGTKYAPGAGRLAGADYDKWCKNVEQIVYSVVSCNTPIYWVCADGSQHIVEQRFSPTTTRHQSRVRAACA